MGIYWPVGVLPLSGVLRFVMIIFLIFFSAGVTHSMGSTHDGVYRVGLVMPSAISKRRKPSPRVVVSYDSEFQTDLSGDVAPVVPSPDGDFMSLLASLTWPVPAALRLPEAAVPLAAQVPPRGPGDHAPRGANPGPLNIRLAGVVPSQGAIPDAVTTRCQGPTTDMRAHGSHHNACETTAADGGQAERIRRCGGTARRWGPWGGVPPYLWADPRRTPGRGVRWASPTPAGPPSGPLSRPARGIGRWPPLPSASRSPGHREVVFPTLTWVPPLGLPRVGPRCLILRQTAGKLFSDISGSIKVIGLF